MVDMKNPVLVFTAEDRCDRCGARALAIAEHETFTELLFCLHHLDKFGDSLIDEGWEVTEDYAGIEELVDA